MAETQLVGIVNVTPDSFSDGGENFDAKAALRSIERHLEEGAHLVDIGAESTRPDAVPVAPEEEWRRLEPVLAALPKGARFSVDTRHAEVARKALEHGAQWINDVSGFADAAMVQAVKSLPCKLVVMHSLSVPADKNIVLPEDADVVQEVQQFARARLEKLEAAGIARARIIFDPGIGFGKTPAQSRELLQRIGELRALGVPLLVGHSRKSFLGVCNRDAATLEWSEYLARQGVDYLRVHDVAAHKKMLERVDG